MKINYLILLLILTPFIYSQETIKKTKNLSNLDCTEVYNVLKSDKSILHGSFQRLSLKGTIYLEGYYKNGLKDSIWKEYNWNGKLFKIGTYNSDKKVGLWEFYDYQGNHELTFNFSTNEPIFFKQDNNEKNKKYNIISAEGYKMDKLDRPPLYLGGSVEIGKLIGSKIKYPVIAQENNVSGVVEISFTIDINGKTSNYKVKKGIGSGCDEEALRVVKMIPENWLPGIYNGQTVTVEYVMPVIYKFV